MHPSDCNIGAYLRSVAASNGVQGYPPSTLASTTDHGDGFSVLGAKSCVLTATVGEAAGSPTAQSTTVSLESSTGGSSPTWVAVADSSVELTANEKSGEVDVNLTTLPSGHSLVRCKVVVALTGGSSAKQSVAATVTLGGFSTLPV